MKMATGFLDTVYSESDRIFADCDCGCKEEIHMIFDKDGYLCLYCSYCGIGLRTSINRTDKREVTIEELSRMWNTRTENNDCIEILWKIDGLDNMVFTNPYEMFDTFLNRNCSTGEHELKFSASIWNGKRTTVSNQR